MDKKPLIGCGSSMNPLRLYTLFHCNLDYSSIEESQRPLVVSRCYWPLFRLARKYHLPLGVEMSGHTLETLERVDRSCLKELRWLITEGNCELIGSGYAQIIGPLVPAEVNAANLRLGHEVYQRLLGIRPKVALINEQAYSASLVPLYLEAEYEAIVMEWDNPSHHHPKWNPEWGYLPQYACSSEGEEIPLIWNNSISFQKFQRYACREMELEEHVAYLEAQISESSRAFPLYGNDIEVFDFRPGRYAAEPKLQRNEWKRIERLFQILQRDGRFRLCRPSEVLDLLEEPHAANRLHLESTQQPIPVKKQGKYNVTRWAATGKDDLGVNTTCWRIYQKLKKQSGPAEGDWKELCYLWGSDFRTHITDKRWSQYRQRLHRLETQLQIDNPPRSGEIVTGQVLAEPGLGPDSQIDIRRQGRFLVLETSEVRLRLNCRRGLAIEEVCFKGVSPHPLFGTLPHGYYSDIDLAADYYTGHVTLQTPGESQITDLNPVEPVLSRNGEWFVVSADVDTDLGSIQQQVWLSLSRPRLELRYYLDWPEIPSGSLRLGHITLNPEAFQRSTLFYRTCNGGYDPETFFLAGNRVCHGEPVSFLVSASQGLGLTDGIVELGDAFTRIRVEVDKTVSALVGMMSFREVGDQFFCRLELSALELDETVCAGAHSRLEGRICITAYEAKTGNVGRDDSLPALIQPSEAAGAV